MRFKVFCVMLLGLGMMVFAGAGFAGDFSADMVSTSPEGSFIGKIYVSGEKSRMETVGAITISRMDKKIAWILMPTEKMYMEQALDARSAIGAQEKIDGEIERIAEGRETVNGRATTKYRVTYEAQGKREMVFQWIDGAEQVPVKTAAVDGSWSMEFKNMQAGPQDQALFEIPAGYQKMSFSMPSMEDMMSGRGN